MATAEEKILLEDQSLVDIEKTLPTVQAHAKQIAVQLYKNVFALAPSVKCLFSLEFLDAPGICPVSHVDTQLSAQAQLVSDTIIQFARLAVNGQLPKFDHAMARICAKHVSRGVEEKHFPVVLDAFAQATHQCIGHLLSDTQLNSWKFAVQVLADELIKRELALAAHLEKMPNSWSGFRKFVARKKKCSVTGADVLGHSILVPCDGCPVAHYTSGQYVCVRMKTEEYGLVHFNAPLSTLPPETANTAAPFNVVSGQLQNLHSRRKHRQIRLLIDPESNAENEATKTQNILSYDIQLPRMDMLTAVTEKKHNGQLVSTVKVINQFIENGMVVEVSPPVGGFILQKSRLKQVASPLATHRFSKPLEQDCGVGFFAGQKSLSSPFSGGANSRTSPIHRIIQESEKLTISTGNRSPLKDIINRNGIQHEENDSIRYLG